MKSVRWAVAALAVACAWPLGSAAQVVREDGVKSIAGVLVPTGSSLMPAYVEWTFKSAGGEVLFASLDADIYRKFGEEGHATMAAPSTGGGSSGGEEDGGPWLFTLFVRDQYGADLCKANRPAPPPGWQRDPRMACVLPASPTLAQLTYTIRVELNPPAGHQGQASYPFLLNVSLRKIAKSGTNIQSAIATSGTNGF